MRGGTLTAAKTEPTHERRDLHPRFDLRRRPSIPWKPTRFPGVEAKTLMENPATGMSTVLMRWAPGARLPHHEHVAIEQTFVLEGSFADHMGVCRAGNYVWRRQGSRHDAWTDEGCLMLAFFLTQHLRLRPLSLSTLLRASIENQAKGANRGISAQQPPSKLRQDVV
jgi:hypothetical protein